MKKLVFTAIAMVAFSGASMANTKEIQKEKKLQVKETILLLPVGCATRINFYMGLGMDMMEACRAANC
jgi:hypothetical protein